MAKLMPKQMFHVEHLLMRDFRSTDMGLPRLLETSARIFLATNLRYSHPYAHPHRKRNC
jgi:hypothetical protein